MLLEEGRICIKKYGRDAGKKAVIVGINKNGYVKIVTSMRNRERACNPKHLEFLNQKVDIKDKKAVNDVLGVKENISKNQKS